MKLLEVHSLFGQVCKPWDCEISNMLIFAWTSNKNWNGCDLVLPCYFLSPCQDENLLVNIWAWLQWGAQLHDFYFFYKHEILILARHSDKIGPSENHKTWQPLLAPPGQPSASPGAICQILLLFFHDEISFCKFKQTYLPNILPPPKIVNYWNLMGASPVAKYPSKKKKIQWCAYVGLWNFKNVNICKDK